MLRPRQRRIPASRGKARVCRAARGNLLAGGAGSGAKSAIARAGIDAKDIVVSSPATTQGETFIPIGPDGEALRNAIVWLDERAGEQAKRLSQTFDAERFYRETGLPELNGYTPVAKLLWLKENEPEVYEKTVKFLLLEDYILYRLTGGNS